MLISSSAVYAAAPAGISVYLRPDVTIKVGDQTKSFYDAKNELVYPIIYQGTTYLPVRAIAALMGENIEWDSKGKTIYIGRTLSDPTASEQSPGSNVRDGEAPDLLKPPVQIVDAYAMPNIIVMYDFEVQSFLDATGREVYPINYKGSKYLPIRAMSLLMGESIEWDAGQKLITISASEGSSTASKENKHAEELKKLFSDAVTIFDEATAKIVKIQDALTAEEFSVLVTSAGRDVNRINRVVENIENVKTAELSDAEHDAYNCLLEYAESASYYIQIAENIIYMASEGQDYSVFGETFLDFALDSQTKYNAAKDALRNL